MAQEEKAASPADAALAPGSAADAGLEGTASTGTEAAPAAKDSASSPDARISALMSKWQSEQAENERLRTLLAEAVAIQQAVEAQLIEVAGTQQGVVSETETKLHAAEASVAELTAQLESITAELTTLRFVADNPDLAPYRAVLPTSADSEQLKTAAATIRQARDRETTRFKDALTTPSRAGQTPRAGHATMSPTEIRAYLDAAPPGEFDLRLREVTGRA